MVTCDTHRVQLMQINNGATYSEGLDRIEVSYDHEKYRLKLIVRGSTLAGAYLPHRRRRSPLA